MGSEPNRVNLISQLTPGMKNINLSFIVLDVGQSRRTPQGHDVRTVRVADPSGSVLMGVWNDVGEFISTGDIWRLRNGFTTIHKGSLNLAYGKMGEFLKTGDFFMLYVETPNMSEPNPDFASKFPQNRKGSPEEENGLNGQSGGGGVSSTTGSNSSRQHPQPMGSRPMKRPMTTHGQSHYRRDILPHKSTRIS